ncbi:MAG: ADP-forming succinate--CoA ligase subunit beta [SAR202 cluster bacterium]|nr:ADP-forming succinate--CoA ligase subunit beta [SAR202 cluster bacterium]|tara:strand:+ start:19827 stop:20984 length:1158 start_codon:yes stop_codon:yes gene_type:complete
MKVHEYQAKAILSQFGIPVPDGGVASTSQEVNDIIENLGGSGVVKAQIHAGGRGMAGGVKVVGSAEEAATIAGELLGAKLVTHQTGPEGAPVDNVLIEKTLSVSKEYYLAIVIDGSTKSPVIMASEAGGMDIEEVAAKTPERIIRVNVDSIVGLQPFQCRALAYGINIPNDLIRSASTLIANLYRVFEAKDCSLAEINPLAVTEDGQLLALDAKLNFDDDALFRHPDLVALRDPSQEDPLEVEASKFGINYVKLDGDVGCMVNGAGLAMATMDSISMADAMPANFLDVGGGATEEQVSQAFSILLADPQVKRILVNVFGGILRCDVAARGIVAACKETEIRIPIVVRMLGTNADEGKEILAGSGLTISLVKDLKEAASVIKESAS